MSGGMEESPHGKERPSEEQEKREYIELLEAENAELKLELRLANQRIEDLEQMI